jgi:alpha-galactosidase
MSGNFGYELDLCALSAEEKETVKQQIAFYKEHRALIQTGDLYRLKSPFEGNETAWMVVSGNRDTAFVFYERTLAEANPGLPVLRLAGLDPQVTYHVEGKHKYTTTGELLMQAGIRLPALWGDFQSCVWILRRA